MASRHPGQQPTITIKSLVAQLAHNRAAQVSPEVAHNRAAQVSPEVAHNQAAQVSPEVAHNRAAQVSPEVAHNGTGQSDHAFAEGCSCHTASLMFTHAWATHYALLQQSRGSHITPMRTDLQHMNMIAAQHMTPQPSTLVRDKAYVCLHPTNSVLALCSRHGPITHCNLR
ncbi:hypothetical protein QJQ45_017976 [Haematococcus lacustris]|nr:hypothetical protein QJQ45_017976 [Haematococcus lacustris]